MNKKVVVTLVGLASIVCTVVFGQVFIQQQQKREPAQTPPSQDSSSPGSVQGASTEAAPSDDRPVFSQQSLDTIQNAIPSYPMKEITQHSGALDCWVIIDGHVYDFTTFISDFSNGKNILPGCGKDVTTLFKEKFSEKEKSALPDYLIGKVER